MPDLIELGTHYGTDKVEHNYMPFYQTRFDPIQSRPIALLEIGIMDGASLRTWRDYFEHGRVFGVDIDPDMLFEEDRIKCFEADQSGESRLQEIAEETGPLDIVIDDGSHCGRHHVVSFNALWPFVKSGGWYCIEDCQSIFNDCWTQPADPTMFGLLAPRWQKILTGTDTIAEVTVAGDGPYSGIILIRKL